MELESRMVVARGNCLAISLISLLLKSKKKSVIPDLVCASESSAKHLQHQLLSSESVSTSLCPDHIPDSRAQVSQVTQMSPASVENPQSQLLLCPDLSLLSAKI